MTLQAQLEKSTALIAAPKKIVFEYATGPLKGLSRVIADAHMMCDHLKLTALPLHIANFTDGVHPVASFGLVQVLPRYAIYREITEPIVTNTFHPEQQ